MIFPIWLQVLSKVSESCFEGVATAYVNFFPDLYYDCGVLFLGVCFLSEVFDGFNMGIGSTFNCF